MFDYSRTPEVYYVFRLAANLVKLNYFSVNLEARLATQKDSNSFYQVQLHTHKTVRKSIYG